MKSCLTNNNIKSLIKIIANIAIITSISLIGFFLLLSIILNYPLLYSSHKSLLSLKRDIYLNHRPVIQYSPDCARYDNQLLYTLKEGQCLFGTADTGLHSYKINKFGIRDDEDIKNSKIAILGDSFAMGWGVDNKKIFPSILEENTKKKVVNMAISSYGTAREFTIFRRIFDNKEKLKNLEYLILQYCGNDYEENIDYVNNNYQITKKDQVIFSDAQKYNEKMLQYNYFRQIFKALKFKVKNIKFFKKSNLDENNIANSNIHQFSTFLDIVNKEISTNKFLPKNLKIIIFNTEPHLLPSDFYNQVSSQLKQEKYKKIRDKITLINIPSQLNSQDYFLLDDHINENGHKKIAEIITNTISNH